MNHSAKDTEDLEIRLLLEALFRAYQQDFRGYAAASIKRRLLRARDHFGCRSFSELQHLVLHHPGTAAQLLPFLTVQVSEMFRDPPYFRTLREKVVPHLKTYPSLKVWVAGCSTGEELYSLVILFREEDLEQRTIFYATDINAEALRQARDGIYDSSRIPLFTENHRRSGGTSSLSDYYVTGYNRAKFDDSLRQRVVFSDHSLVSDAVFTETHLISCRNVFIYFKPEVQNRTIGLFHDSLVRNGFLGLGLKESLRFSNYADAFSDFSREHRIYRKTTSKP
jgi:chemotaxis protein methyltransferase CheR